MQASSRGTDTNTHTHTIALSQNHTWPCHAFCEIVFSSKSLVMIVGVARFRLLARYMSKQSNFRLHSSRAYVCVFAELLIIDDKPAREKLHRLVCPAGNKMHFLWFDEEGKSGRDESRRLGTAFICARSAADQKALGGNAGE
jgi:hypothetical protein